MIHGINKVQDRGSRQLCGLVSQTDHLYGPLDQYNIETIGMSGFRELMLVRGSVQRLTDEVPG